MLLNKFIRDSTIVLYLISAAWFATYAINAPSPSFALEKDLIVDSTDVPATAVAIAYAVLLSSRKVGPSCGNLRMSSSIIEPALSE